MTTLVSERVAAGAAWLDKVDPGWEFKVDPNTLSMKDGCRCVCGQVFAEVANSPDHFYSGYAYVRDVLRPQYAPQAPGWPAWSMQHGFTYDGRQVNDTWKALVAGNADSDHMALYRRAEQRLWEELRTAWQLLIEARRAEPIVPFGEADWTLPLELEPAHA